MTLRAVAAAARVSEHAGVAVHELDTVAAIGNAADLLAEIWETSRETPPINADVMRALAHSGNYVVGVYAGADLVGASVAFRSGSAGAELHSHISGLAPTLQNKGAGFALKLHQRAWALERGIGTITWTVDPLVRRNMLFNLAKLRADAVEYLPNFYGTMRDGINAGDQSDRLLMVWRLASARVVAASEGRDGEALAADAGQYLLRVGQGEAPVVSSATGQLRRCQIPADIVALRSADPALAGRWRQALRAALGSALGSGWRIADFTRQGDYLLVRSH